MYLLMFKCFQYYDVPKQAYGRASPTGWCFKGSGRLANFARVSKLRQGCKNTDQTDSCSWRLASLGIMGIQLRAS